MKTFKICLALVGTILLGSCAVTDIETTADFSKYRTFGFGKPVIDVKDPEYRSGLIDARIKNAMREEFQKRGLDYSKNNPDLIVTYQTYTEERLTSSAGGYMMPPYGFYPYRFGWGFYPGFYGWGFPYGGWGYPYGYGGGRTYQQTEGTLIIDINDRRTGDHIWRGQVSGYLNNPAALQKQLDKAVRAIIKKYPVAPTDERIKVPAKEHVS